MLAQDSALGAPAVGAGWISASLPFLLLALLLVCAVGAAGVWMLVQRTRELARLAARLSALEDVRAALEKLVSERDVLDLRRLEHVLIEIRDGQRRVEDGLLRAAQSSRSLARAELSSARGTTTLHERVIERLLALGYERIQIVTPPPELPERAGASAAGAPADTPDDRDVMVEALREGMLFKGRVLVRNGLITDVEMKPALAVFP